MARFKKHVEVLPGDPTAIEEPVGIICDDVCAEGPKPPECYRSFFAFDDLHTPLDTVIMSPSDLFPAFLNRQHAQGFKFHSFSKVMGDRYIVIFEKI